MKYERLTERKEDGEWHFVDDTAWGIFKAFDRLAELENKIERGELISTVKAEQGDQEVAFFVAHNATIRKQAVKEFADKIITSGTTTYDALRCTEFIKLPMERYKKLINEVCGK